MLFDDGHVNSHLSSLLIDDKFTLVIGVRSWAADLLVVIMVDSFKTPEIIMILVLDDGVFLKHRLLFSSDAGYAYYSLAAGPRRLHLVRLLYLVLLAL